MMNLRSQTGPVLRLSTMTFALLVILCCSASAQHFASNEDLRQLRGIGNPRLSPDGKSILVELQDNTAAGGQYHLWLLQADGSQYRQLTGKEGPSSSERDASFLPDGKSILFQRDSKIVRLSLETGIQEELEIIDPRSAAPGWPLEVDSYNLSPDGQTLAVLATDPPTGNPTADRENKQDMKEVGSGDRHNRLFLVDRSSRRGRLVPSVVDINSVAWNAQSDRLLILSHTRPSDFGYSTVALVIEKHNPDIQTTLMNIPPATFRATWLHSGKGLVLFAQAQMDTPIGTSDLYTFDLASGRLTHLEAGIESSTLSPRVLYVSDDDKTALISITHGVRRTIGKVDLSTGAMAVLDLGMPVIQDFSKAPNSAACVFVGSSSLSPASVYYRTSLEAANRRPSQPPITPSDWTFASAQVVEWKRAGLALEGLLYVPAEASASRRVPLIVMGHGGPSGQFTDTYTPIVNLLVAQGWAVFAPNPRGSTGYGQAFEAANKHDLGNGDFLDIMAGVDEVLRTQPIDSARLAFIGHSYGGEMAAFVEGKTDRFKAVISSAPVSNAISTQGTAEDSYADTWFTGKPWRDFDLAWKQSPLAYVANAKTPILLLHGENDAVDPPGQSHELYHALRMEGVAVRLLLFPRESHSSLGQHFYGYPSTEPWHGTMLRQAMIDFIRGEFAKLAGSDQPAPAAPPASHHPPAPRSGTGGRPPACRAESPFSSVHPVASAPARRARLQCVGVRMPAA